MRPHPLDVRILNWFRDRLGKPLFEGEEWRRRLQRAITDYGWSRILAERRTGGIGLGLRWAWRRLWQ